MHFAEQIPPWLSRAFFWPGEAAIEMLQAYPMSMTGLLWLNDLHAGSPISAAFSAVAWLMVLRALLGIYRMGRALDDALTSVIMRYYTVVRLKSRIFLACIHDRMLRLIRGNTHKGSDIDNSPSPIVSKQHLLVLNLHAALPPAHSLPLGKIASELNWRRSHTENIVTKLTRLHLLSSTLSGDYGDEAYILTRKGRACLASRHAKSRLADE
jgi:hypothetical protein